MGLPRIMIGALLVLGAACKGPHLHIVNPGEHTVFLDGYRIHDEVIEFRYYGTSRFDTLPRVREEHGVPQFEHIPSTEQVVIPEPSSLWLFPIDFALEVIDRAVVGRRDQTVTIIAVEKPPQTRIDIEIPQEELGKLSARGHRARIER